MSLTVGGGPLTGEAILLGCTEIALTLDHADPEGSPA